MFGFFKRPPAEQKPQDEKPSNGFFSTEDFNPRKRNFDLQEIVKKSIQVALPQTAGMDSADLSGAKTAWRGMPSNIPDAQVYWYSSQGFIGYQLCAILAQQWLVQKACSMPARDAVRNGYEITVNDGQEVDPAALDRLRKIDDECDINSQMVQFVTMGRIFGIRLALFVVDSPDPDWYQNPFNEDGVRPGSYRGISQIDPYWITPELDIAATGNPAAIDFYEPTWWRVNGVRYHKSHFCIFRGDPVADVLKPSYLFGGISVPQKIYERVYAAERTANEAPLLAMTKRLNTLKLDMTQVAAASPEFQSRMEQWIALKDNFGVKIIGEDEEVAQLDTSLTDLDEVIMTQYQLVAAASNVPATKLLGTTPKGFNSTGDYEESNYHEELITIQAHDLTKFLNRHHRLCVLSEIKPKMGVDFVPGTAWEPLDAPTAKEWAEINKIKAETDAVLADKGSIDGTDIRNRLITDPNSGYNGLEAMEVDPVSEGELFENGEQETL